MWIMLKEKLPTCPSPPKMSIHWSTSWPNKEIAESQKKQISTHSLFEEDDLEYDENDEVHFIGFGKEPNWARARSIFYKDEKIRVFPNEFTELNESNFRFYINEEAIELQYDEKVASVLNDIRMTKGRLMSYEAALVDGCDHYEALMVTLGRDPSEIPPPIGWWKLKEEYASQFCYEKEMVG